MKKSSSLESLQTMVQEIQMADEPRGPNALRTPRGRGREEILRAAVERPETQPKKHWLLEDAAPEVDSGGFVPRGSPFQSSLNDGKHGAKNRPKKNGLFRGIGHMFRFGKHRKDGIAPVSDNVPADYTAGGWSDNPTNPTSQQKTQTLTVKNTSSKTATTPTTTPSATSNGPTSNGGTAAPKTNSIERSASSGVVVSHPPLYQPPPPPPQQQQNGALPTSIHHTDVFNHRYSHYVNYEELQQQISRTCQHHHPNTSPSLPFAVPARSGSSGAGPARGGRSYLHRQISHPGANGAGPGTVYHYQQQYHQLPHSHPYHYSRRQRQPTPPGGSERAPAAEQRLLPVRGGSNGSTSGRNDHRYYAAQRWP